MDDTKPIWQYIPYDEYSAPTAVSELLRRRFTGFRQWLRAKLGLSEQKPDSDHEKFDPAPSKLIEQLTPRLDWAPAADALVEAFDDWPNSDKQPPRFLISPPGSGTAEVAHKFAEQCEATLIEAPSVEELLKSDDLWEKYRQSLSEKNDSVFVIPRLERFYLRKEHGLDLVRQLLHWVFTVRPPLLVGCNSWAWAYLRKLGFVQNLASPPLVLAPLDAERLQRWLNLADNSAAKTVSQISRMDTGQTVFANANGEANDTDASQVCQQLAAASRGIPAVALALWRRSLRVNPTKSNDDDSTLDEPHTVWTMPVTKLSLPKLPSEVDSLHRYVLHAILVHGGLWTDTLFRLLPFSQVNVARGLSDLEAAGITESHDEELQISPLAYPVIRQHLCDEGFLVDDF